MSTRDGDDSAVGARPTRTPRSSCGRRTCRWHALPPPPPARQGMYPGHRPLCCRRLCCRRHSARRTANFVDGCFWHGCPELGGKAPFTGPNPGLWKETMRRNAERDRRIDCVGGGTGLDGRSDLGMRRCPRPIRRRRQGARFLWSCSKHKNRQREETPAANGGRDDQRNSWQRPGSLTPQCRTGRPRALPSAPGM